MAQESMHVELRTLNKLITDLQAEVNAYAPAAQAANELAASDPPNFGIFGGKADDEAKILTTAYRHQQQAVCDSVQNLNLNLLATKAAFEILRDNHKNAQGAIQFDAAELEKDYQTAVANLQSRQVAPQNAPAPVVSQ
jgi:hypothetical protein